MDPFALKLLAGFAVGGIWVALGTVAAERAGTKAGGVIAGLPSTVVVALFFIGWTQSPRAASEATTLIPMVLGIVALFNVTYASLYRFGFLLALISALVVWATLAFFLVRLDCHSFPLMLAGFVPLVAFSCWFLERVLRIRSEGKRDVRYTPLQLVFRGVFGGGIIAGAVVIAKVGGPIVGGVFATFPAVMLATMVVNHFAHGPPFATAFVKAIAVSGTINATVYAVAVRYTYPSAGLVLGTFVSFAASLVSGYIVYLFVSRKMV